MKDGGEPIEWTPSESASGYTHFVGDQEGYEALIRQHGEPFHIRQRGPDKWRASWKVFAR